MKVDNPVCVRPGRWCLDSCDTTSAAQTNSDELHLINRGSYLARKNRDAANRKHLEWGPKVHEDTS